MKSILYDCLKKEVNDMLSKKNIKERLRKVEPKHERFSIRKFTIGAASVLIGLTLFGISAQTQTVHASDTTVESTQESNIVTDAKEVTTTPKKVAIKNQATNSDTQAVKSAVDNKASQEVSVNKAKESETNTTKVTSKQVSKSNSLQVSSNKLTDVQKENKLAKATPTTIVAPVKTESNNKSVQAPTNQQVANKPLKMATIQPKANNEIHVKNETQFQDALNNAQINQIVLDNSINNNEGVNYNVATGDNGRNLVISGNGTSITNLDLSTGALKVTSNPSNFDLTFKDLTLNTNNDGAILLNKNGAGATINFQNVTGSGSGVLINESGANVSLDNVTATSTTNQSNVVANNVIVGDNVNLTTNQSSTNINASGSVTINGKNVNLTADNVTNNGTTSNIIAVDAVNVNNGADVTATATNAQGIKINNISAGSLNIAKDSNLTVNALVTASGIGTPNNVYNTNFYPQGSNAVILNRGGANIYGDLTINANSKNKNSSGVTVALAINSQSTTSASDVIVGSTGNLTVNAVNSPDTRGVAFLWSNGNDNGSNHNFGILENGKATFNMGHGVSNALWNPDNIILKDGSSLIINTLQDNNGNTNNGIQEDGAGVHSGPITMSFWPNVNQNDNSTLVSAGTHATIDVEKDATLRIIRSMDSASKQVGSPMITYGGNGSNSFKMSLLINGGIFDLEDAMQYNSYSGILDNYQGYLYNNNSSDQYVIYPMGMVAMYGTGAPNEVVITDPELFKMVRTGKQQGMLFRLEGAWNKIVWNAGEGKYIPIEYSTLPNVVYNDGTISKASSYKWNVTNIASSNVQGNGSMNYYNPGYWAPSFGNASVYNIDNGNLSPATVTFKDGTSQEDEGNFKQYFNYWSATNLVAGTALLDSSQYKPEYANSTVRQGGSVSVTPTYPKKSNVNKDGKAPEGTTYALGKDAVDWATIDKTTGEITFKPSDTQEAKEYTVPVVVTYPDNSSNTVNAIVTVIESDANKYDPKGQTVSIPQDTPDSTVKNDAEKGISNKDTLPKDTTYTWKDTPDVTKPGKAPATIVVTYPDGSSKDVPTNVIVDATPTVGSLTVYNNEKLPDVSDPIVAKQVITNLDNGGTSPVDGYPESIKWTKEPNISKAGKTTGEVVVTYPDGTTQTATVPVNVIGVENGRENPNDSDVYDDITRTINIEGQKNPIIQHVIYTRTKYTNLAEPQNEQITYSAWNPEYNQAGTPITTFSQVDVTKAGYTATASGDATIETIDGKQYVPASGVVKAESKNQVVNVTYSADSHTLTITYLDNDGKQIGTYDVTGKTDETVNIDVTNNVPKNWQLVPGQNPISSYKFGPENPEVISYKIEHKTETINPTKDDKNTYREISETITFGPAGSNKVQNNIEDTVVFTRTGIKDLVTGETTYTDWKDATGKSSYEFKGMDINQFKGYISYLNSRKSTEVPAETVNADSHNIIYKVIYVAENATPIAYNPGTDGINDDMNRYVTRTIVVHIPTDSISRESEPIIKVQTVHFTNEDEDGNSGYQDPATGKITYNTSWHVAGNIDETYGQWDEYTAPEYKGYIADPIEVKAERVTYSTPSITTDINYKAKENLTDADKYTPTYPEVAIQPGETKKVSVEYKDDKKPDKATYEITPDSKVPDWVKVDSTTGTITYAPSNKETTQVVEVPITVTYPDGSKNTTKSTVIIVAGKDNVTDPIDPKDVIQNPDKLPKGTTITWTKGKEPDVTKHEPQKSSVTVTIPNTLDPKKPIVIEIPTTVTYPDHSNPDQPINPDNPGNTGDNTNPVTPTPEQSKTDADKYTPIGQDIHTTPGQIPNPADGIKNKNEMPSGTTYTWKNTPDVSTEGTHKATIVVTYPDGSTKEISVNIIVKVKATNVDNGNINNNTKNNSSNKVTGNNGYMNDTKANAQETVNGSAVNNYNESSNPIRSESSYETISFTNPASENRVRMYNANATYNKNSRLLPQTGEVNNNFLAMLGLALTGLGLFAIEDGKKKKKN